MDKKDYRTVLYDEKSEFVEKKSRFIGAAKPVKTEEEALEFIAQKKKEHYDAKHNVYAYIIRDSGISRFSDDGEPSGTAGMPVLEVIKKENLTDVCVVVTRYFGGVLLGAGGLVRAYSKSAKIGLEAAVMADMLYCKVYSICCSYDVFGKVKHLIENRDYILEDVSYGADIFATVCVKLELCEKFLKEITEITNGNAKIDDVGEKYTQSITEK